ncbi:MAG: hypothetical protein AB1758_13335, partial [Candidatus Eremiobacterota bacterium]
LKGPVVQGTSAEDTARLRGLAEQAGFAVLPEAEGKKQVEATVGRLSLLGKVAGAAFDWFLDGFEDEDRLHRGSDGLRYRAGGREEEDILDVVRAAGAAALAQSPAETARRTFQA